MRTCCFSPQASRLKPQALAVLLVLVFAVPALAGDHWPAWRGPQGTGHGEFADLPIQWSDIENVAWKTPLPAPGNSTPVIWGDRLFVTGPSADNKARTLMCFNKADGKQLWTAAVDYDKEEKTHRTNPYNSASPVTDGERIIVWHGSAGLHCYNFDGMPLWKQDLGEFDHIWGYGGSPVFYKDLVILNAGPGVRTFLVAFNKKSGDEVWRRELDDATSKNFKEFRGSWSTPVLFNDGGRDLMALSTPKRLIAFDPANGETVWSCEGLSLLAYTSPLVGDGLVVAMCGYHGPAMAVKTGGKGDVTETHRLWLTDEKNPQRVGSGVLVDDHIYILNDNGVAWCIEAKTGERKWQHRLGGNAWPSASYVDGRIYTMNQDGITFVFDANPKECKLLAKNPLDETTRGSHAFADGRVFVRTYKHLWCLGKK